MGDDSKLVMQVWVIAGVLNFVGQAKEVALYKPVFCVLIDCGNAIFACHSPWGLWALFGSLVLVVSSICSTGFHFLVRMMSVS